MSAPACAAAPGPCRYGSAPQLELDTGNALMPRVEIWRCLACGHGVTRPAMADVSPLYAGRASDDYLARDAGWIARLKRVAFRRLAARLLSAAGQPPPRLIADYGTGNGMLARALGEVAGSAATVHALDFFDDPPGPIAPAHYLGFAAAAPLLGRIDLLTCFHVLEHDDDSDAMLARISAFLRPGGTLVLEVPNVDCVWTPWFGTACANWYAPFHRVHFTRDSLRALFERHGLEIVRQENICGPTFALSLAAVLKVAPNGALFALALGLRPLQWLAERLTRRPSALRITARRP